MSALKNLVRSILPRGVAPRRILAGPLRGRRVVTSWHDYPGAVTGRTELPLLQWFASHVRRGETWLDVGGHYGYTAIALSEWAGPGGRVFTFEPVIASAGCIAQTRLINHLDQLTVVPVGLGCPESLEIKRLPVARGMADMTIADTSSLGVWESIQVARFDWLWPRLNAGNAAVHGVKIDVQGMEIDVLVGMRELLHTQRPAVVIELHHDVDRARVLNLLGDAGYSAEAVPIEPEPEESRPRFLDNHSYAFEATR
jgi:FkbM family methyltransferase